MIVTRQRLIVLLIAVLSSSSAMGAANLQITEMWVGGLNFMGLDANEQTSDWFEVTNFGDMAATGLNGTLYYDDNSDDPTKDDPLVGIDTIAPGESAIYLVSWEDDFATASEATTAFNNMWGPPAGSLSGVQVGYVEGGSGLGGGGDAVNIFDGNTADAMTIDRQQYQGSTDDNFASFVSDANGDFGFPLTRAMDGVLGAYTGNLPAAIEPMSGGGTAHAIGSPGTVVPEPTAGSLVLLALGGLLIRRR